MRPFIVQEPVGVVVPVDEALRLQCRVDPDEEDVLLADYVAAAVSFLDGYTGRLGRCILSQRWAFPVDRISNEVALRFPDCRDFSVEHFDGADWTPVADVSVTQCGDYLTLEGLPSDRSGISVLITAGWDSASKVPPSLKQAIRMLVAHWFENRGAVTTGFTANKVPLGAETLFKPFINVAP